MAISIKSLTICSTSLPTYPTSVNLVASTLTKGASANFDNLLEISVFPTPAGVGKTEISRRLSKLAEAPFVKVEATRFTEVGYVGRDVEQIVRDLIEIAISMEKVKKRKEVFAQAQKAAEEKVLDALVGKKASLAKLAFLPTKASKTFSSAAF